MTQTISGNLSDPARIIILNESDMVIEHNATTSGSYEVSGLSDGNKVVLARAVDGETFGYASVSGIAGPGGLTELLSIYDCTDHSTYLTANTHGNASTTCRTDYATFAGENGSELRSIYPFTGGDGANLVSTNTYSTAEKIILEFYWWAYLSNWHDDNMSNTANYLFFVKGDDYTFQTATWSYNNIDSPAEINVHMRRSGAVTLRDSGTNPDVSVAGENIGLCWLPMRVEVDWPTNHIKIWKCGNLLIDEDLSDGLADLFGGTFNLGFHWHDYNKSAYQAYGKLKLSSGEPNDAREIPFVGGTTSMVESEWGTQDSSGQVTGGALYLDAPTGPLETEVSRPWLYKIGDDFDLAVRFALQSKSGTYLAGLRIRVEDSPDDDWLYIDRRWNTTGEGMYVLAKVGGVLQTPQGVSMNEDFVYESAYLRIRRTENTYTLTFGSNVATYFNDTTAQAGKITIPEWEGKYMTVHCGIYKYGTNSRINARFDSLRVFRGHVIE